MKRYIFTALTVIMLLSLFVLSAGASESNTAAVESVVSESAAESEIESSDTVETSIVTNTESATAGDITESEAADVEELVSELISGSESKAQVVIGLAGLMGITVEDAEALIDSFIAFGDEHFEEDDLWTTLKADISTHPDKWLIVAFCALVFLALVIFLIRSVIKNTMIQTNTKIKIASIESHAAGVEKLVQEQKKELDEIKSEADELREMIGTAIQLILAETESVDSMKANSERSLELTGESVLQILQLLNIAMDRKVPIVSEKAKRLWYEDAVAKVKAKVGATEEEK